MGTRSNVRRLLWDNREATGMVLERETECEDHNNSALVSLKEENMEVESWKLQIQEHPGRKFLAAARNSDNIAEGFSLQQESNLVAVKLKMSLQSKSAKNLL
ncbi:Uncharacterized protein TCM_002316 [Theobroma cacao]|uniref:Uncharacterized protein n=1 Tax=Theobroma cacao TaxID=3641 RepID=A0A061DTW2_THECC|nr:Uncharacterized protein TCM_002316 [Theobroma cacao]